MTSLKHCNTKLPQSACTTRRMLLWKALALACSSGESIYQTTRTEWCTCFRVVLVTSGLAVRSKWLTWFCSATCLLKTMVVGSRTCGRTGHSAQTKKDTDPDPLVWRGFLFTGCRA